jgi:hypothetical protein
MVLRAARNSNIKPTSMLFHTQPTEPWKSVDFLLLTALEVIEAEICNQCGQPTWLCRSTSSDFRFVVKSDTCYATRALEQKRFDLMDKDSKKSVKATDKKQWGVIYSVIPELIPTSGKTALPTRRDFHS